MQKARGAGLQLPTKEATILLIACLVWHVYGASESTDASKSIYAGPATLTTATAGTAATFTITSKDESGVSRTSGGDIYVVELEGTRSLHASIVDSLDGSYVASYTATKAGQYDVSVKIAKNGGLSAAYYENVWFFYTPVLQRVDPTINMDWGTGLITAAGSDYISIRWTGKVRPDFSEEYTFFASSDDGCRLWVDNTALIDRWDSRANDTSATVSLSGGTLYPIKMEYKEVTGTASVSLSWASASTRKAVVPASKLYYETHILQSPFTLDVAPAVPCGSRSTAVGDGTGLATAGAVASMTIQANDEYDNELLSGGAIFSVRARSLTDTTARGAHATVTDEEEGQYFVEYTPFTSGSSAVYAQIIGSTTNRLSSTYYDDSLYATPLTAQTVAGVDISAASNPFGSSDRVLSARYRGFVKTSADATCTFSLQQYGGAGASATLTVDSKQVLTRGTADTAEVTATLDCRSTQYYDLELDYVGETTAGSGRGVRVAVSVSTGSFALHEGFHVIGSPFALDIKPARICASTSVAAASTHLTEATAGIQRQFTVTAKDLYSNIRTQGGDGNVIDSVVTGVSSSAGAIEDHSDGTYTVRYTVSQSGTYDNRLSIQGSLISGSPWRVYAEPNRLSLGNSEVLGMGLTLATAGITSDLTMTVRDIHNNWQPTSLVSKAGVTCTIAGRSITSEAPQMTTCEDGNAGTTVLGSAHTQAASCPNVLAAGSVATPTTSDRPTYHFRYQATTSGVFNLGIIGTAANHDSTVRGSPFALTVMPHVACSTTSTASGPSLSIVTAGVAGTFTVQARDGFHNVRGSHVGDFFVGTVRSSSAEDQLSSAVDLGDSRYVLSFTPNYVSTSANEPKLWVQLAVPGGFIGTVGGAAYTATTLDFSGAGSTGAAHTARYSGFFRPSVTGRYTFALASGATTGSVAKFAINNANSAELPNNSAGSVTATVDMIGNSLYEIDIDYQKAGGVATSLSLQLKHSGSFVDFPSDRIYVATHISSSPFSLNSFSGEACAVTSNVNGMAISLVTAGVASSYTVTARDNWQRLRDSGGDLFAAALLTGGSVPSAAGGYQESTQDGGKVYVSASTAYGYVSTYYLNFTSTAAGRYALRGQLTRPGGLHGDYFETDNLLDNVYQKGTTNTLATKETFNRIDSEVNFDWEMTSPVATTDSAFSDWSSHKDIGPDFFSVRWTGFVRSPASEVFTFSAEADDGVRLWVDDLLIIDQWNVRSESVDGTIALINNDLYAIKLEYRDMSGPAFIKLRWSSRSTTKAIIPSDRLYSAITTTTLSQTISDTEPATACAATSTANGPALTIGTAGIYSYFTVTVRDSYGNIRKHNDNPSLQVRLAPITSTSSRSINIPHWLTSTGHNFANDHNLLTRLPQGIHPGGLTATYFNGANPTNVACHDAHPWGNTFHCHGPDFSQYLYYGSVVGDRLDVSSGTYAARYRGYFKPSHATLYTFTFAASNVGNIEAKVDGTSMLSGSEQSFTFQVPEANAFHEIEIYFNENSASAGKLDFKCQSALSGSGFLPIPTTRLFPLGQISQARVVGTAKGQYSMMADLAHLGALTATFFDNQDLVRPVGVITHSSIDYTWTGYSSTNDGFFPNSQVFGTGVNLDDVASFSVRWQGFFKPLTATTTFSVGIQSRANEKFKLWLDNNLVVDKWYDRGATAAAATESATEYSYSFVAASDAGAVSGTNVMYGDLSSLFDIKLEYTVLGSTSKITLNANGAVLPSANMYQSNPISGSPFSPFTIEPAVTCATVSTQATSATQTAGIANSFTVTAKDQWANDRDNGGEKYWAELHSRADSSGCTNCPQFIWGTINDLSDGSYTGSYLSTKEGLYYLQVVMGDIHNNIGGLSGSYYPNTNLNGAPNGNPDFTFASTNLASTARFAGFIQPPEAGLFTFSVKASSGNTAKMYIEDFSTQLTAATFANGITATYAFPSANSLYSIRVEFSATVSDAAIQWDYASQSSYVAVPTTRIAKMSPVGTTAVTTNSAVAFGGKGYATGNGLTMATAGSAAVFSVTSHDAYFNSKTANAANEHYMIRLQHQSISGDAVHASRTYSNPAAAASYTVTLGGKYHIEVARGSSGGLVGEYFNNMWLQGTPAHTEVASEVSFDWGTSAIKPPGTPSSVVLGADYMSVRWSGFFYAAEAVSTKSVTFWTETDEGVRLYIDDKLVIDQWNSAGSQSFSYVLEAPVKNALYPLKLEMRDTTDNAFAHLMFSSDKLGKHFIPKEYLYHTPEHVEGSPFAMWVYPSGTCASASSVVGPGLSMATVGAAASFSITTRDQWGNDRTTWQGTSDEELMMHLIPYGNPAQSVRGTIASTNSLTRGDWHGAYTPTTRGSSSVLIGLQNKAASNDGVTATYYASSDFTGSILANSAITGFTHASFTAYNGDDFTARYRAYTAGHTGSVTYAVTLGAAAKFRLFVGGKLAVDSWSTASTSGSAGITLDATAVQDVTLDVLVSGTATMPSVVVTKAGSNDAYEMYHVIGGVGAFDHTVQPDAICATTSTSTGAGMTVSTAGVPQQFTITVRDKESNIRVDGGDEDFIFVTVTKANTQQVAAATVTDQKDGTYLVQYTPSITASDYSVEAWYDDGSNTPVSISGSAATMTVHIGVESGSKSTANAPSLTLATAGMAATFTVTVRDEYDQIRTQQDNFLHVRINGPENSDYRGVVNLVTSNTGKYNVVFRPSAAGTYSLAASVANSPGLKAEYFRDDAFSQLAVSEVLSQVDANYGTGTPKSEVGVDDGYTVQYSGFLKPQGSTTVYTFYTGVADTNDRVKLWIDDHYVVDKWATLPSATEESGTIFLRSNMLYDIKLQYNDVIDNGQITLQWLSSGISKALIPSGNLFSAASPVSSSPFSLTTFPGLACGATSFATGNGLSVATSGQAAYFTITAKDFLGNLRTQTDDEFVVRVPSSAAAYNNQFGTVTNVGAGTYSVAYTPTQKGTTYPYRDVELSLASSGGLTATYFSTAYTAAASVATAGPSSFTASTNAAVKFVGFYKPTHSGVHTVSFGRGTSGNIVVNVAGKQSTCNSASACTVEVNFPTGNSLYDLSLTMVGATGAISARRLIPSGSYANFAATELFMRNDIVVKTFEGHPGLAATYYSVTAATSADTHAIENIDWSGSVATERPHSLSLPGTGEFYTRWTGFFKPSRNDLYTFSAIKDSDSNSLIRLWVDPAAYVPQTNNELPPAAATLCALTSAATSCSGTVRFMEANELYEISAEYKATAASKLFRVTMENGGLSRAAFGEDLVAGTSVSKQTIPGSALYKYRSKAIVNKNDQTDYYSSADFVCEGTSAGVDAGAFRYQECRGQGQAYADPAHVHVSPAPACGGTSVVQSATSTATAGVVSTFTMLVKDEYDNTRENDDEAITSRQYLQSNPDNESPFVGSVVATSTMGTYDVSTLVTRSGNLYQEIALAQTVGNGLKGVYYNTANLSGGSSSRNDAVIDFNWGLAAPITDGSFPTDSWSARWTGFVRPSLSSTYTFYVLSDDGSRLYVNNKLMFDRWSAAGGLEHTGTIALQSNIIYDIRLEYKDVSGSARLTMSYSAEGLSKEIVPSARLYPMKQVISSANKGLVLFKYHPNAISGPTSSVNGDDMTLMTAGVAATFTITARDTYGNTRTADDSAKIESRLIDDAASTSNLAKLSTVSTVDATNGLYRSVTTVTRSGSYTVRVGTHTETTNTGLAATYYDDDSFSVPLKAVTNQATSENIALTGTVTPSSLVDDGIYSIRWAGFFVAGAGTYTATITRSEPVKVWVDGVKIIDRWVTDGSVAATTGTIGVTSSAQHELEIEFKSDSTAATRFQYTHTGTSSNIHYASYAVSGEHKRLVINPHVACGVTSVITGAGNAVTVGTAGVSATFTMTVKDQYSNLRGGGDVFVARAMPDNAQCSTGNCPEHHFSLSADTCSNCPPIVYGSEIDVNDGTSTYVGSFAATKKGHYKVVGSTGLQGGLLATYYGSSDADILSQTTGVPAPGTRVDSGAAPDFSATNGGNIGHAGASVISARFIGFVRPSQAAVYTFHLNRYGTGSVNYANLYVDNQRVVAITNTDSTKSGTFAIDRPNQLHDILLTYYNSATHSSGVGMYVEWESLAAAEYSGRTFKGKIPTDRLYSRGDVTGDMTTAAKLINVAPAGGSAATSSASGTGLTRATAGVPVTFTITSRDAYSNQRESTSDMSWVVQMFGAGGSPNQQATVATQTANQGLFKASYTQETANTYSLFVRSANDNAHGSPFELSVYPNEECGVTSTISGVGLTSAVVNVEAAFTIQARDRYGNAKTQAVDASNTQYFFVRAFYSNNGANPWIAGNTPVSGTFSGLTEATSQSNGKYSGTYKMTTVPTSGTAYTHAAFGIKGGLLATYYQMTTGACSANSDFGAATAKTTGVDAMTNANAAGCGSVACSGLSISGCFGARFAGFVKGASNALTATFSVQTSNTDYMKVWINGELKVDQWSSSSNGAKAADVTGAPSDWFEMYFNYKAPVAQNPKNLAFGYATTELYAQHELSGSPFTLTVAS